MMRAKRVVNKGFFFDFDDTLFSTESQVHVYDNDSGKFIKSLTADEFNAYKKLPSHFLDFQDFTDGKIVRKGKPMPTFELLKKIDEEISEGTLFGDIYILTARTPHVQKAIFDLLRTHGIKNIAGNDIICMGDGRGEMDIPKEKKKILKSFKKKYDKVYFYDDSKKNIEAMKNTGIKSYLIEEYIEK